MSELVVEQAAVGLAAREWDEHHLRLVAAATQVADAPLGGFASRVLGPAAMFCCRWAEHLREVGAVSEDLADGLRDALRDVLASDETSALDAARLHRLLTEAR